MTKQPDGMQVFGTTYGHLRNTSAFASRAHIIPVPPFNPMVDYNLMEQVRIFWRVLCAARREDILLLYSSRGSLKPELMTIVILGLFPKRLRPAIVLNGPMWEPKKGIHGFLEKIIVRLVDRATTIYGVQSTGELELFPRVWNIAPSKVRFVPYLYSFSELELKQTPADLGNHIFSGGNSHRDYEPLIEAARQMPEYTFILATRLLDNYPGLPSNVIAHQVPHAEFVHLMQSAAAVVTPMKKNLSRSTGHQTYLNSMWLKKPTIVNDVLGVRDHIQHMKTGIIVEGSAESYVTALRWVFDPKNKQALKLMCENAADDVNNRFSREAHAKRLVNLVDEARIIHQTEIA